jgi:hypothetical protein
MAGFLFRLETVEGDPAEPRTLECAVPTWSLGDGIDLGHRALVVVGKREGDADRPPVLVVEEAEVRSNERVCLKEEPGALLPSLGPWRPRRPRNRSPGVRRDRKQQAQPRQSSSRRGACPAKWLCALGRTDLVRGGASGISDRAERAGRAT